MFDLHTLGWSDFQRLCHTITREVLGQTVEMFLDSGDGGRDGAFSGHWKQQEQEELSGRFVIQCKHTSKRDYALRLSDLTDEAEKARRLVATGRCDSYVLMTNAGISGTRAEEIESLFRDVGVQYVRILGSTWLTQQIVENKRLRMLVPRVYGLGDLSQIIDERAYAQAREVLESMREDLAKVVVTDAYRKAATALDEHGFVLLIGEPAAGKTTIASLLAIGALDQWGASTLKLDTPGEVSEHWNPEEHSQFFWIDDAFGVTQYERSLVDQWNRVLPKVRAILKGGGKIVMTSRDYIYNQARKELKESAFPMLRESQVVIDVHELSLDERRQILYNHLKLGRQPHPFRSEIKPFLDGAASHKHFIPETARRLADPLFTAGLNLSTYGLDEFIERREQLLLEVIGGLDVHSIAALALIYMRNGQLESPINLKPPELDAMERLGSDIGNCSTALKALEGSLVLLRHRGSKIAWQFKHPTIGDALASILAENSEYLGIYIEGTTPDRLIEQVTCGRVGIRKAIVVPNQLFPNVLEKLAQLPKSKAYKSSWWSAKHDLYGFLSYRCSKAFLSLYVKYNPVLTEKVATPGLYLYAVPETRLAQRLHQFGLLPEKDRITFVATVSDYVLRGEDSAALRDERIKALFSEDEHRNLLARVTLELIPRIEQVRIDRQEEYSLEDDAEEHMQSAIEFLDTVKDTFTGKPAIVEKIDREIALANDWILEQEPYDTGPRRPPRTLGDVDSSDQTPSSRSIFDDIDADDTSENDLLIDRK